MLVVTIGFSSAAIWAKRAIALPVYGTVPAFKLTDQHGEIFDSNAMKGKVWAVHFLFTRCKGICPAMNSQMQKIMNRFQKNDRYELVSITIDPEYDTADILKKYAVDTGSENERWKFLTGSREELMEVASTGLKIAFPNDPLTHSERFILIGPDMKIRGYYSLSDKRHLWRLERDSARLLGGW